MRHLVVGTAGHIDHGKSALVRAITGTNPDRLKEEQERGITIDLGFADVELAGDRTVSFVDVPGHERFVRHMVAGATGIEAVILVIAADEGVKPQTREHLAICSLLGIEHGIVALTKSDLVEAELREVVTLEVGEALTGTFLERAPVLAVSAKSGEGLRELTAALSALFDTVPPRPVRGVARLPVDRSFVLQGFGTVVTGTLASGTLTEGQDVEVVPGRRRGRIRGLQVHGKKVREAVAGQRTAVNLQGLDCDEAPRGSTVTKPDGLLTTRRIWVRATLLADAPADLEKGGRVRFHQGTCERDARLRILGRGTEGALNGEIVLAGETVILPGDRFVLRRPAPVDTVGGGTVLDTRPPRASRAAVSAFDWEGGASADALVVRLERAGDTGRDLETLSAETGLSREDLERSIEELEASGKAVTAGGRVFAAAVWGRIEAEVVDGLERFHDEQPLRPGMSREALRALVCRGLAPEPWRILLAGLEKKDRVRLLGERVASSSHRVVLSARDSELARRIESRIRDAGLDPPDPSTTIEDEEREHAALIMELLVENGTLVRLRDGRLLHGDVLTDLTAKLKDYARTSKTIDVGTFKQLAGVSRKNAIPLLEYLDAERRTRRVGNVREILI